VIIPNQTQKSKEINNIANLETGVTFGLESEYENAFIKTVSGKYVIEMD
jgi:hypothetical protein